MKKLIIFVLTLISMNISVTSYAQPKVIDINMIKYTVDKNEKVTRKECYQAYYNCLLYTSPSPRDRTRSRMPSSA